MEFSLIEIMRVGAWALPAAAAFGGAKVALNGTRQRVKKLEEKSEKQGDALAKHGAALASIESKLDLTIEHLTRK